MKSTEARPADPNLEHLIHLLRDYDPDRIILFGSRARGEANRYSDYDPIVIKQTDRPFLERLADMVLYLVQFNYPAEILVYTPEEFERMKEVGLGWIVQKERSYMNAAETAQQAAERFVQTVESFLRRHTGVLDEC